MELTGEAAHKLSRPPHLFESSYSCNEDGLPLALCSSRYPVRGQQQTHLQDLKGDVGLQISAEMRHINAQLVAQPQYWPHLGNACTTGGGQASLQCFADDSCATLGRAILPALVLTRVGGCRKTVLRSLLLANRESQVAQAES